jgi:hypothetical protein
MNPLYYIAISLIVGFFVGVCLSAAHCKYLIEKAEDKVQQDCSDMMKGKKSDDTSLGKYSYAITLLTKMKRAL